MAGDYKDLVFENNTDAPIYIQGIYTEGAITFNVYGHDTRKKGHSVKYVSKTISTTPIKTKTQKDSTKSEGYREVIPGHVGYVAELYKITYENGKEVSKELVHTSTYRMSPTTTIIGTKKKKCYQKHSVLPLLERGNVLYGKRMQILHASPLKAGVSSSLV